MSVARQYFTYLNLWLKPQRIDIDMIYCPHWFLLLLPSNATVRISETREERKISFLKFELELGMMFPFPWQGQEHELNSNIDATSILGKMYLQYFCPFWVPRSSIRAIPIQLCFACKNYSTEQQRASRNTRLYPLLRERRIMPSLLFRNGGEL